MNVPVKIEGIPGIAPTQRLLIPVESHEKLKHLRAEAERRWKEEYLKPEVAGFSVRLQLPIVHHLTNILTWYIFSIERQILFDLISIAIARLVSTCPTTNTAKDTG